MTSRLSASLFALLLALPACGDLTDVPVPVMTTVYRPDGQLVVFTTAGIKVYDGDLASEIASIPLPATDYLSSFDLSYDGRVASVSYDYYVTQGQSRNKNNEIRLYGMPDGSSLGVLQLKNLEKTVTLAPGGDLAFAFGGSSELGIMPDNLYRLSDGAQLWSLDYKQLTASFTYCKVVVPDNRAPPVFTADGKTMFVAFGEYVTAVDVATGTAREFANARACIAWIDLLPDGSLLVLRGFAPFPADQPNIQAPADEAQESSLAIFATDGSLVREIPAFSGYKTVATIWGGASQVACASAADRCAIIAIQPRPEIDAATGSTVMYYDRFLLIWNLDGTLLQSIAIVHGAGRMSFSPDGTELAIGAGVSQDSPSTVARIYRVSDGTVLAERSYTSGVF